MTNKEKDKVGKALNVARGLTGTGSSKLKKQWLHDLDVAEKGSHHRLQADFCGKWTNTHE